MPFTRSSTVSDFAARIKGFGFRVFIAEQQTYGFITDDKGERVLNFSFNDGGSLGGNYGPPSRTSGTGWRMNETPYDLKSAQDVRRSLHAMPPEWCRRSWPQSRGDDDGWRYLTTVAQYLAQYQKSSKFEEL